MEKENKKANQWLKLGVYAAPLIGVVNKIAPAYVKKIINRRINQLDEFGGKLGAIDFSILSPGFSVSDFELRIIEKSEVIEFLQIEHAKIVFDRKNLLRGRVVGDIVAKGISLVFFNEKTRIHERIKLKVALPVLVRTFEMHDISIDYIDELTKPPVELSAHSIYLSGVRLTNIRNSDDLPTQIEVRGNVYEGELFANMGLSLLEEKPALDLNFELKNIDMPKLNNLFSAYGHFTVSQGSLSFYTEAAAKEGRFKGYVKPIVNNLQMTPASENDKGLLNKIWEDVIGVSAAIFENHKEKQLASKIPFEGTFKKPDINVWYAVVEVLKNAFVCALKPHIDHEININSLRK